uniref:Uncharacterized protein n=1 Tax=Anguilla anguilla TaxID=7936 RepID=A0A0E9TZ99_ANGAN
MIHLCLSSHFILANMLMTHRKIFDHIMQL